MIGLFHILRRRRTDVALALSSGGALGLAHIGVIDVLEQEGYHITSVAGTSMGSIVGAMLATGHLADFKAFMRTITRKRMLELTDFTVGKNYFVKGERIIEEMKRFCPDVNIEDLPLPYCCCATDWTTGREVVFDRGPLWQAVRASMSYPGIFEPVRLNGHLLIDGGLVNPLPLNRVARQRGDLLVGVNASSQDYEAIFEKRQRERQQRQQQAPDGRLKSFLKAMFPKDSMPGINYYTLLIQASSISITSNARRAIALTPPDILVDVPFRDYGGGDFDKYDDLRALGEQAARESLGEYNK